MYLNSSPEYDSFIASKLWPQLSCSLNLQGWEKVCSTKKMNRFHPPEVKQGLQQLDIAKEHSQAAALAAWEAFLGEFALHYAPFRSAVMALASLDALHSLATLACNSG